MSSGHSRSPCLSFVRRRDGEARESWAGCCPAPLQSRSPQRRDSRSEGQPCAYQASHGLRTTFLSTTSPGAHPPLSMLASVVTVKILDDLLSMEDEGGGTSIDDANVDRAAGVGIIQSLYSHLRPRFWAMRSLGSAQWTRHSPSSTTGKCNSCKSVHILQTD